MDKIIISLAEINVQQGPLRTQAVAGIVLEVATPEDARVMAPLKSADGTSF